MIYEWPLIPHNERRTQKIWDGWDFLKDNKIYCTFIWYSRVHWKAHGNFFENLVCNHGTTSIQWRHIRKLPPCQSIYWCILIHSDGVCLDSQNIYILGKCYINFFPCPIIILNYDFSNPPRDWKLKSRWIGQNYSLE